MVILNNYKKLLKINAFFHEGLYVKNTIAEKEMGENLYMYSKILSYFS